MATLKESKKAFGASVCQYEHASAALALYKRANMLFPKDDHLVIEWAKLASDENDFGTARELVNPLLASFTRAVPPAFPRTSSMPVLG